MKLLNLNQTSWREELLLLPIFLFPIVFLTVRHAENVTLFILLAFVIFKKIQDRNNFPERTTFFRNSSALLMFSFGALFLSVFITQLMRGVWNLSAFDGPSKLLVAGLIIFLLGNYRLNTIKVLQVSIPLGLIFTLLDILINPAPSAFWGGRFATYFVDPNTMGSQSTILCLLCFALFTLNSNLGIFSRGLLIAGAIAGLYISMRSGSRGGWTSLALMFPLWLYFVSQNLLKGYASAKGFLFGILIVLVLVVIGVFFFGSSMQFVVERVLSGYFEITTWFNSPNKETSAGIRLSLWKFSFEFIRYSPWFGFGENSELLKKFIMDHQLYNDSNKVVLDTLLFAGPHSDFLSKLLSMGIIGISAYVLTLCIPFILFWKRIKTHNLAEMIACQIGILYIAGIFMCGLSNEMLSLKYLCSFFGLMVLSLLLQTQPVTTINTQTSQ